MVSGFRHVKDQMSCKFLLKIRLFWRLDTLNMAIRHVLDHFWGIDTHAKIQKVVKWRIDTPTKVNKFLIPHLAANRHVMLAIEHIKLGIRHRVSNSLL